MRDISYILKRVIIGVLIATTIIFLKNSILTAHAEVLNPYLQVSGTTLPPGQFAGVSGSYVNFKVDWVGIPDAITQPNDWMFVSVVICRTWASPNAYFIDTSATDGSAISLGLQNTQMICPFSNSPYNVKGRVTIVTFKKKGAGTYNPTFFRLYTAQNSGGTYYTDIQLLDIKIDANSYVNPNDYANLSTSSQLNDLISATNSNTTAINNASQSIQNSVGTAAASIVSNIVSAMHNQDEFLRTLVTRVTNGFDAMTDDSIEENNSQFSEFEDYMATNGVITNLITMPVTLFTKVLNTIDGTCTTYNLGSLYGTDLTLPCVDISDYLGSTLWGVIDVITSGVLVYAISRHFVKVFNKMSSLEESDVIDD